MSVNSSVINEAVEAVMDMVDALGNFALCSRGSLGTGAGIVCETAPSTPEAVFMDKNSYIPLDLTFNAKHSNLKTLTDTMNNIHDSLTRRTTYPDGQGWEIVDIVNGQLPQIIGREDNNDWLLASTLIVKIYRKDDVE